MQLSSVPAGRDPKLNLASVPAALLSDARTQALQQKSV
jgi:hypothetical protein